MSISVVSSERITSGELEMIEAVKSYAISKHCFNI
jgi:hypothetical protein